MNALKDGWFSEINELWPGQCMSLQVEEILFHEKSDFQDILVVKSKIYGNVLCLDGVIQITEYDECAYQEMIALLPVNSHPNPENVLVIGGGDGGVVRELDKNPLVRNITQCEIDKKVVEVAKKYLPYASVGFESSKLKLLFSDGCEFMRQHEGEFDVIITDSSDPVGPASTLFQKEYYELMKKALKPDGIVCAQGECLWLHLNLIKEMQTFCKELYPVVDYSFCSIPTYPSGQIGFLLCSKNKETNFRKPIHQYKSTDIEAMRLKYYNSEVHSASFVLPQFAYKVLRE